jgi:hypothetical protein
MVIDYVIQLLENLGKGIVLTTVEIAYYNHFGFSNFFVLWPFPNTFKISATLKFYKLQQI